MILGFKPQFVEKILSGSKIHTIREGIRSRWREGMKIHFATGVRTKNYKQFKEGICMGTRRIEIEPDSKTVFIIVNQTGVATFNNKGVETLAKNDGFDSVDDFWVWFNQPFSGRIIYWTKEPY